ncbi:hypothetical protein T190611E02C_20610 [Tenacibaculum sp. 190524A05c]
MLIMRLYPMSLNSDYSSNFSSLLPLQELHKQDKAALPPFTSDI